MNDFQREIYKTIDILTEQKLSSLGFDRTKHGRVVSINGVECVVQIDGENYTCKLSRGIYVEPNDIVFVKFPQDSSVDKYVDTILGGNETPENMVISAQEILDKIKTVDGAGSGLNADLLDGKHASEFATLDDLEDMDVDISGESIVASINASQSIIDDKNLSENVNDAIDKKHSHTNKSTIDSIKQDDVDTWDTVINKSDKIYVDNKLGDKVDKVEGKGLSEESYSTSEKSKLTGIETGANKYIHPDTHPANMIEQNSDNRFTTDVEKANWNAKETATGAQTKANVAESNAKTYTDNHIADNTKHISSNERNLWNTVEGKVDKITGKQLSDESYTLIEKNKLSGIEVGANKYNHPNTHSLDIITETTAKKIMTSTERDKLAGISNNANKVESSLTNGNIKIDNVEKNVYTHPSGTNPHGTTKSDVGLGNVDNTSDLDKPISTAAQTALNNKSDKGHIHDDRYYTETEIDNKLNEKIDNSGNSIISGTKTFSDTLKVTGIENFDDIYIKRTLGSGSVGTTYINLSDEIKNGGYHRFWKISFPTGASFLGKIKITLYGGYSSFNASGSMAKEINVNFNTGSIYSNVGCYTELSGYVEKDFRISEAIWNVETSQWEFWIYSHQLQGNNVPYILMECWAKSTSYINYFNQITFNPIPAFLQDTTYQNVKGNAAGQTLVRPWSDLPTYQNPYGETIASVSDLPTKLSQLTKDIDFDERYYTESEMNTKLNDKVDNSRVLTDVPSNAKFIDTTYSEMTTAEIDAGTSSTLRTITGRRIKYTLDKVQGWINSLTKSDVGLSNVDNTSDLNKPISSATQTALNSKVDNSRVLADVPINAKFTDTIYTHPSNHPASMITESAAKRFVSDSEKSTWNSVANKADKTYVDDKVKTDVPVGAKFTDTVYSHPPTHPASMITDLPTGKKVARFVVGTSTAGWTAADCDYLCDGTADQTEINNAITALPETGGEIVILDGTYNITANIDVTKDNVSIRGNGNATILKRMFNSASSPGVIALTGRSGCNIANLQVDGNSASFANLTNSGISLYSSSNNTIIGNTCNNNNSYGIRITSSGNNTVTGNTCSSNKIGILLYDSSNNTVTGNTCTRGTGLPTDYTAGQNTIWLASTDNNYNLISNNNCMGKMPMVNGGTGNSVYGNKYDSGDYKDFTQDEKTKLSGIQAGAQVNTVTSVAGKTGAVAVSKSDVGLGNVTNDKQMPISGGILENYREKLVTLSGTSTTINLNNGNVFTHTLSGDTVYSISNAQSQAHSFTLIITQTETVGTITFPASVKWQGGEIPDLSGASKTYVLTFLSIDGGTTWLGMYGGEFGVS